eukprot:CAMPEP_0194074136 /NCGR_PEP_ID=MMETSP0149-20130528/1339_1 /TAXON_ID=122233 /ORGANISM="Chaetoceros debilis, Strain MM31A-1" /LENGTH=37 /DNA_ID= /DNA_START= /DNA_END= /DNA_ORIENTATION=
MTTAEAASRQRRRQRRYHGNGISGDIMATGGGIMVMA